jgi:hypothetical protein
MRSEVLTAGNLKITIFWEMTLCNLVESYQLFIGTCCFHLQIRGVGHEGKLWHRYREMKDNGDVRGPMGDSTLSRNTIFSFLIN